MQFSEYWTRRIPLYAMLPVAVLCSYLVATGRLSYLGLAAALALAPLVVFVVLVRPYLFPYGFYVALIPFDNLVQIDNFGTASRLFGLLSGFVLLLYGLTHRRFNVPPVTVLAWALYVTWCAATIMWAIDPKTATSGAATIAQLLLLYTIVSMAPLTRNDLRTVLGAAIAGGVVAGLYGAWTFHNQLSWELAQFQEQVVRLQLSNGDNSVDPNHFADSLLFPLIAAVVFALRDRVVWRKLLFTLAAGAMLGGIYFAGSRESLLAFGIAVVYVLVAIPRFRVRDSHCSAGRSRWAPPSRRHGSGSAGSSQTAAPAASRSGAPGWMRCPTTGWAGRGFATSRTPTIRSIPASTCSTRRGGTARRTTCCFRRSSSWASSASSCSASRWQRSSACSAPLTVTKSSRTTG